MIGGVFGGVVGGVGVLLRKVVLSELGGKVVELVLFRESFEGCTSSDVAGWVGLAWGWFVFVLLG